MIFEFESFILDTDRELLLGPLGEISMEPRAYALLCALVENHDRLVSKEELLETVWNGIFVSDAAVSTAIKSVRQALGDNGSTQALVRTVRGRGFRFVAKVAISASAAAQVKSEELERADAISKGKPKVAILPFYVLGPQDYFGPTGDAIPAEIIASISRLHWLEVVARGSSFRFRGTSIDLGVIRTMLGAGYCVSGMIEAFGADCMLYVELSDTHSGNVVWTERFSASKENIRELRPRIVAKLIAALDLHVPRNEAEKARVSGSETLDAWSCYHVGLQHMYRINRHDNEIAKGLFEKATQLDPRFSDAYSAWSFCRFQDAFTHYDPDLQGAVDGVRRLAELSLDCDPDNPSAHFSMGRSFWLGGRPDEGVSWMNTAINLDPNFARAYYSRGMLSNLSGNSSAAIIDLEKALLLSPIDPLVFAVQGTMALSLAASGGMGQAFNWISKAARHPRAHYPTLMLAVAISELAGHHVDSRDWKSALFRKNPTATVRDLWEVIPHPDTTFRQLLSGALRAAGIPKE